MVSSPINYAFSIGFNNWVNRKDVRIAVVTSNRIPLGRFAACFQDYKSKKLQTTTAKPAAKWQPAIFSD